MTNYLIDLKNAQTSQAQSRALELFYNETAHLVFSFCRKKGVSPQDGEDIVQIVYTQIYNKRQKYNPNYSPLAWLFIITKSEAKDYLKKSATYSGYLKDYGIFVDLSQNSSDNPNIDMKDLNPKEQQVLQQRYLEEKDFSEIATTLGLTETNVRKIISRAIQKLRG